MRLFFLAAALSGVGSTHHPKSGWTCFRRTGVPGSNRPSAYEGMVIWGRLWGLGGRELGFFLSQETQQYNPPRLVGFVREQTPVVLDIQLGHGSIHAAAFCSLPAPLDFYALFNRAATRRGRGGGRGF